MAETNLIDNLSEPALPIDHCDTFIELEEYHLDENTPEPVSKPEPVRTATKTRKSRSWHLVRIYDDGPQAKEWLTQNPDWSLQKMYDTDNHQIFTVGCIRVGLKPLFFDETKDWLVSVKKTNLVRRFDYVRVRQNISSEKAVNGISFWLFRKHSS